MSIAITPNSDVFGESARINQVLPCSSVTVVPSLDRVSPAAALSTAARTVAGTTAVARLSASAGSFEEENSTALRCVRLAM